MKKLLVAEISTGTLAALSWLVLAATEAPGPTGQLKLAVPSVALTALRGTKKT